MKPIKNKIFCKDCGRTKMLFETEKKAENFIKFNKEEIETESGYSPQRTYYCLFCGGWHTTSIKEKIIVDQNKTSIKKSSVIENQEEQIKKINYLKSQTEGMELSQKEKFFTDNINNLNKEIDLLLNSSSNTNKEKLNEHRQNLAIHYKVRKQIGLTKSNKRFEETKEKEMEEWRLWAEKKGY